MLGILTNHCFGLCSRKRGRHHTLLLPFDLLILLLYLTRKSYRWQTVVIVCAVSLGTTQAIKSGIKQLVTEPRPYVAQMQTTGYLQSFDLTEKSYYQLKKKERAPIVRDRTAIADEWLVTDYQATELGYSFPSGHTIFAVSWLLLAVGFLAKKSDGRCVAFSGSLNNMGSSNFV